MRGEGKKRRRGREEEEEKKERRGERKERKEEEEKRIEEKKRKKKEKTPCSAEKRKEKISRTKEPQKISRTATIERAMEFDDGEWVVTDGTDIDDPAIDGDWVVDNGDEGAVAGIFFHAVSTAARRPTYVPFGHHPRHLPDPALSFLPPAVSVRSSSHGLLLCRDAWSSYYVCNPTTARWTPIPCPPRPTPSSPLLPSFSSPAPILLPSSTLSTSSSRAPVAPPPTISTHSPPRQANGGPIQCPSLPTRSSRAPASRPPAWHTGGWPCRRCSPTIHPPAPPG